MCKDTLFSIITVADANLASRQLHCRLPHKVYLQNTLWHNNPAILTVVTNSNQRLNYTIFKKFYFELG